MKNPDPVHEVAAHELALTFGQRARLAVECLPVVFFTLALVFSLTFLKDLTGVPPPRLLILFLGLVLLVTGAAAINRIRDLASGVARIQEDRLERSWRSRGSPAKPFHGKFERLGTMRLSSRAHGQGQNGSPYRVCYSPASKIVWSLERLP
jgi:hypothetical protein